MLADTVSDRKENRQPRALRDLQRDWENWSLGEKIAMALIPASSLLLLSLVHWV